jgi:hypothetical protein
MRVRHGRVGNGCRTFRIRRPVIFKSNGSNGSHSEGRWKYPFPVYIDLISISSEIFGLLGSGPPNQEGPATSRFPYLY